MTFKIDCSAFLIVLHGLGKIIKESCSKRSIEAVARHGLGLGLGLCPRPWPLPAALAMPCTGTWPCPLPWPWLWPWPWHGMACSPRPWHALLLAKAVAWHARPARGMPCSPSPWHAMLAQGIGMACRPRHAGQRCTRRCHGMAC